MICVFCGNNKGRTSWPEGGYVCDSCIPIAITWRHLREKEREEAAAKQEKAELEVALWRERQADKEVNDAVANQNY